MTTNPLDGRVALVTGAGRRVAIGAAVARRLAADGAAVLLHSWAPHDDAQHDGRPGGRVLFFTSGQYHGAMPGELPYIASKGALHQLTRSPADTPRLVAWLVGDEADWVTGQVIASDGGWSAR